MCIYNLVWHKHSNEKIPSRLSFVTYSELTLSFFSMKNQSGKPIQQNLIKGNGIHSAVNTKHARNCMEATTVV